MNLCESCDRRESCRASCADLEKLLGAESETTTPRNVVPFDAAAIRDAHARQLEARVELESWRRLVAAGACHMHEVLAAGGKFEHEKASTYELEVAAARTIMELRAVEVHLRKDRKVEKLPPDTAETPAK